MDIFRYATSAPPISSQKIELCRKKLRLTKSRITGSRFRMLIKMVRGRFASARTIALRSVLKIESAKKAMTG